MMAQHCGALLQSFVCFHFSSPVFQLFVLACRNDKNREHQQQPVKQFVATATRSNELNIKGERDELEVRGTRQRN